MSQKLSTITPTYYSFAKDQLLTHTDLNEVINYFEDQDRLSRICLNGVGIVCGFKPEYDEQTDELYISQGSGVTTDGDLVHFLFDVEGNASIVSDQNLPGLTKTTDRLVLTGYRNFSDTNASYEQFKDSVGSQIQLWELVPSTILGTSLTKEFFDNKTLLIYIDCYSKEPGACTAISCDSQGVEEVRVLRVLVVNDGDLQFVNKHDYLFNAHNVADKYLDAYRVAVPRVVLDSSNSTSIAALASEYHNAMTGSSIVSNLNTSLNMIGTHVAYDSAKLGEITSMISNTYLTSNLSNSLFQYRYDLLKDLVDSYDELLDLFIKNYPSCCPDIFPFPKHLLLGKINPVGTTAEIGNVEDLFLEDNVNRHGFYPSPIITHHYSAREHLTNILDRMHEMLGAYSVSNSISTNSIKITPSKMYRELGTRSIPFYYDPQYDADNNSRLVRIWDFKRKTLRQYDEILGYHQSDISSYSKVAQPLQYNLDDYDFYRIEGHQGLLYKDALGNINLQRDQNGLAFDTKAIGIAVDDAQLIDIDDYTCEFVDLQGQLDSCIDTQNCILTFGSTLLSGYSIETEGLNYNTSDLMGRSRIFTIDLSEGKNIVQSVYGTEYSSGSAESAPQQYASKSAETPYTETSQAATDSQSVINFYADSLQEDLAALADIADLADFDNVIVKNLYAETNGLGSIILDAFQNYPGTNSENTYAYMKPQLDELTGVGGVAENWDADIKQAHIYLPAKILSSAYAASLLMPDTLSNITEQVITNFSTEIDRLCTYIRQYQAAYRKLEVVNNTSVSNDLYALVELLSGSLSSLCCAGEKLQSLYDQIEARKLEILAGLELSRFAEDHPGMEHKAGVPNGGTFILVYAYNESGTGSVQNGTVIADFCLPYLCCSDCRPVNFIIPRDVVSLLLSSSIACVNPFSQEDIVITTTVSPSGATLELAQPVTGVSIVGTKIVITPSTFDTQYLNTPIGFTVNGQYTAATLTAVAPKSVSISSNPGVSKGVQMDQTSFTFTAIGTSPDDIVTWDFGDGSPLGTGVLVQHSYTLPLPNDKANVIMTVTPPTGACPSIGTLVISFKPVSVSIGKTQFCTGEPQYPLTITPLGASPEVTGIGITPDGKYFDPALTPGAGTYTLYSEGTEFALATVTEPPTGELSGKLLPQNAELELTALVGNNGGYTVTFHDPENPQVELSSPPSYSNMELNRIPYSQFGASGQRFLIRLTVDPLAESPCGKTIDEIIFTVPEY